MIVIPEFDLQKLTPTQLLKKYNISRTTIYRIRKKNGLVLPKDCKSFTISNENLGKKKYKKLLIPSQAEREHMENGCGHFLVV